MNACDDCIYTYPDCPEGEYDKELNEVLDLTQCGIAWCAYRVLNDGSYYDGSWHCHRCGKIVDVGGLCPECETKLSVFDKPRGFTIKSDDANIRYLDRTDDSWGMRDAYSTIGRAYMLDAWSAMMM